MHRHIINRIDLPKLHLVLIPTATKATIQRLAHLEAAKHGKLLKKKKVLEMITLTPPNLELLTCLNSIIQ